MELEACFDSGEWAVFPGHYLNSVDIKGLSRLDEVVIRTVHSTYNFLVADPETRHGILTGGILGSTACQALLIESLGSTDEDDGAGDLELRVGSRVLFYLLAPGHPQLMTISGIQRLGLIRGETKSMLT
jgi:hypothetical protein